MMYAQFMLLHNLKYYSTCVIKYQVIILQWFINDTSNNKRTYDRISSINCNPSYR